MFAVNVKCSLHWRYVDPMLFFIIWLKVIGVLFHVMDFFHCLQMLREFSDELVPLILPAKGGGTQSVRVVLTSSKEDKDLFEVVRRFSVLGVLHHQALNAYINMWFELLLTERASKP